MPGASAQLSPASRRRLPLRSLSLIISAALVIGGSLLMYRRIDSAAISAILLKQDWRWLLAALAVYWIQFPITAYRLELVIRWLRRPDAGTVPPFSFILRTTLSAGFIAVTAPVGLVADAAKIGALRFFGGLSTVDAARSTFFDRALAAQCMALLGVAALPLQAAMHVASSIILFQLLICGGGLVTIAFLLLAPRVLLLFRHPILQKFAALFFGFGSMLLPFRLGVQLLIVAINMMLVWITLYCLLRSAGLSADLWMVAAFLPFLQLINSVPFLYMGWGGREIAVAATLGATGALSLNGALAISAVWGLIMIAAGLVSGLFMIGGWRGTEGRLGGEAKPARVKPD